MQEPIINEYIVEDTLVDELYIKKTIPVDELFDTSIPNGSYVVFKSETDDKKTAVFYISKNQLKLVNTKKLSTLRLTPKDLQQSIYMNLLKDEDFLVVCALGPAGTGKTTIALAQAVEDLTKLKRNIILTKPTVMVQGKHNNAFGPVPGDIKEKYAPYLDSFQIVLQKVMGGEESKSYIEMLLEKQKIQFIPIEFTRGCTFENTTLILDEAQNLTWHELKTLMSRLGENSKLIICGDPQQIDVNMNWNQTGLFTLINSEPYLTSDISGTIHLTKCYRGRIPELIYQIDKKLTEER